MSLGADVPIAVGTYRHRSGGALLCRRSTKRRKTSGIHEPHVYARHSCASLRATSSDSLSAGRLGRRSECSVMPRRKPCAADWHVARSHFEAVLRDSESAEALERLGLAHCWLNNIGASHEFRARAYHADKAYGDARLLFRPHNRGGLVHAGVDAGQALHLLVGTRSQIRTMDRQSDGCPFRPCRRWR